jgi:DNA-binding response OmpR family regulator
MNEIKLLIVDDARNLSLLYKEELSEDGYEVDVANTDAEACFMLNNNSYHLVIAEKHFMLDHDGMCIDNLLKTIEKKVPILINTGEPLSDDERNVKFKKYIEKSSDISRFKEVVRGMISGLRIHIA